MNKPTQITDPLLNRILDKITTNGIKSLSAVELIILYKISKGEALSTTDFLPENVIKQLDTKMTPIERFNQALKLSGYDKDFRKIYGSAFTTKGRVTGWFIENDFIAYLEYEDKRMDLIYDNIADKSSLQEFNEMISNIISYIENEFNIKYSNDELTINRISNKYKLNPTYIEFILYK